jgi:urease accessory protein
MDRLVAHKVIQDPPLDSDVVELDYDARHRRRISMQTTSGKEFLLDLQKAVRLADGDGLALSDGSTVLVRARPERVIDVRASDANHLVRIAWHLGNRHLPTQILGDSIRIRYDHVILEMLQGLGGDTEVHDAPFHPERGAYTHDRGHRHE